MPRFKEGDRVVRVEQDYNGMRIGDEAIVVWCREYVMKLSSPSFIEESDEAGHDPGRFLLLPDVDTFTRVSSLDYADSSELTAEDKLIIKEALAHAQF
jgi:hypothetical protein